MCLAKYKKTIEIFGLSISFWDGNPTYLLLSCQLEAYWRVQNVAFFYCHPVEILRIMLNFGLHNDKQITNRDSFKQKQKSSGQSDNIHFKIGTNFAVTFNLLRSWVKKVFKMYSKMRFFCASITLCLV